MTEHTSYPIGIAGIKWEAAEKAAWLAQQQIKRSYQSLVIKEIEQVKDDLEVIQYGALSYAPERYPLFALKSANWNKNKPSIFITGGVHGYETSGVHGALRFAKTLSELDMNQFNFLIAPCVSPWGYETINRWNPNTIDPNRSFYANSPSEEASILMRFVDLLKVEFAVHVDLHETTDTDNSEFRPALIARDGIDQNYSDIPDGFYLVGDSCKPQEAFQKAVIDKVKLVTHIAPADQNQALIGVPLAQFGVINYAARELGLCMGLTDANFVTTTEVYPDSPLVDDENCINAQVAVIHAAIDYLRKNN